MSSYKVTFALFYKSLFISFDTTLICKEAKRKCTIFLCPPCFDVHPLWDMQCNTGTYRGIQISFLPFWKLSETTWFISFYLVEFVVIKFRCAYFTALLKEKIMLEHMDFVYFPRFSTVEKLWNAPPFRMLRAFFLYFVEFFPFLASANTNSISDVTINL